MYENAILTKEEIEEFKRLALEEYEVKLTDEQTYEQGATLIRLFEHLLKERVKRNKR